MGYFVFDKTSKVDRRSSLITTTLTPTPGVIIPQRNTTLMAFIRKGDVWIGSIVGSNLQQITSHPKINYSVQHVMSNTPWIVDDTDNYAKFPRLSYDGKYLAYISITQESLDGIKDRASRIATESAKIKNEGTSEIFRYPTRNYKLHIYNITEQKEESLDNFQSSPQDLVGLFQSLKWATNRNILYFVKDYDLHLVNDNYGHPEKPLTHSILVKLFCGFNCNNLPDEGELFSVNSDGSRVSSAYETGKTCRTYLEYKLLNVDLNTKQISRQSSDLSWCSVDIGPWINNDFIAVEYIDRVIFYKYNLNNWNGKEKIFEDEEYQYHGPITLSPNNRYLAYPIGKNTYGSNENVDMRIRELESQTYIDILKFLQDKKEFTGNKILYAKWDSDSKYLYFTLTNDERNNSSLVRFNIESKEPTLVITDATNTDIN